MEHAMPTPDEQMAALQRSAVPWLRLQGVETHTATPMAESFENVRANVLRDHEWFHAYYPIKDELRIPGERIALVGGGPSLKQTVAEIGDMPVLICGSSHDWFMEHGGKIPEFCAICDPDPVMANYLTKPNKNTTYLVASHSASTVFDALQGHRVIMWHSWPIGGGDQAAKEFLEEHTPGWVAVGGGCTVGLRSISLAIMMGYSELHFFGFDSCLGASDDEHHAYPFTDETREFLGDIYGIKIGIGEGMEPKEYRVAGYQMAQAEHYRGMLRSLSHMFRPIFHGPGLLADMQAMIDRETVRISNEQLKENAA